MNMKLLAVAAVSLMALATPAKAEDLKIYTEDWAFHNREEGGKVTGASTEILRAVLADSGVTATIELVPWARAYNSALNDAGTCVYSTNVTDDRKPLFKWVTPLSSTKFEVYAAADKVANYKITSMEDVKTNKWTIGVYNQDVLHQRLMKEGGYNIAVADDDLTNARKLVGGRLDLWYSNIETVSALAKKDPSLKVQSVFTSHASELALACNKSVDDAVIKKMQDSLDKLVASGERDKIFEAQKAAFFK